MTEALLRLSCIVRQIAALDGRPTREQKAELRKAFAAAYPALRELPADADPVTRLQAALEDCHTAGVPLPAIAECRFGHSALVTLLERS